MVKKGRNWVDCRECGIEHTNPASSSICESCGEKEYESNVANIREYNQKLAKLEAKRIFKEQVREALAEILAE